MFAVVLRAARENATLCKVSILFLGIVSCGALGIVGYRHGSWRFNYPDPHRYPIQGIDVSHHQGPIRWKDIPKEKFRFVFIKATEGNDFRDPNFKTYWKESAEAGLIRGAYHFFTFRSSGAEQAENFIGAVPFEKNSLPPVVDFEISGRGDRRPSEEWAVAELFVFLSKIEKASGKKPILYATRESYDSYLKGLEIPYWIWMRDIIREPSPSESGWGFWQYANNGKVNGISGRVDLNVFRGSAEEFEKLIR